LKTDKQVVTLTRNPGKEGKKAPPRLRKPSRTMKCFFAASAAERRPEAGALAPTTDLEEHRTALRRVFGETLSDEFVDVMLSKLLSVLRPGPFDQLDEGTLNAASRAA
jgi:hypothetical protein